MRWWCRVASDYERQGGGVNLSLYTPVIVKYRDEKTDKALSWRKLLR